MRILYLANIRMPTERAHGTQIMKTCEAFARAGNAVTLAVPTRWTHLPDEPFAYYGIERSAFSLARLPVIDTVSMGKIGFLFEQLTFAKCAFWYALFRKDDLVYSRDTIPLFYISLAKRNFVYEAHLPRWSWHVAFLARRARKIVVISEGLKEWYVERGIPAERIVVAHDAYDPAAFSTTVEKAAVRARLNLPEDVFIPMYIGSLEAWKGYRTFLDAAALTPGALFTVIGGKESEIEKLKAEYPSVRFLGQQPYRDLPENQQAADVLVIPNTAKDLLSSRFTSPLKVFAHMASGVPIVASDVPSIREILSEETALFVAPDDPTSLAEGIRKVELDALAPLERASRAREAVLAYSWSARAKLILDAVRHS